MCDSGGEMEVWPLNWIFGAVWGSLGSNELQNSCFKYCVIGFFLLVGRYRRRLKMLVGATMCWWENVVF